MRHRKSGRQFSRNTSHRRAMLRALAANLVAHERIETTEAKAKELRRVAERIITRARRLGEVAYTPHDKLSIADRARRHAAQRQMARFLRRFATVENSEQDAEKVDLVEKVFVDLAKRFKDRPGGYTRIVKLGRRRGDNAPMTLIEFVDGPAAPSGSAKGSGKATKEPVAAKEAVTDKGGEAKEAKAAAKSASEKATAGKSAAKKAVKTEAAKADKPKVEKPKAAKPKSEDK